MPSPSPDIPTQPVLSPARLLAIRRWGDEFLVFDRDSGETHLLTGLPGRVLEAVLRASQSGTELEAGLAGPANTEQGEPMPEQVQRALSHLRQLGLVI